MARPRRQGLPQPGTVLAFAACLIALGGGAIAAIPNGDGSVTACYVKGSGELRVIGSGNCESDETKITLNERQKIKTADIVDGEVKRSDLADNAVGPGQMANMPAVSAHHDAVQPIPKRVKTAIALGEESYDTANMHAATNQYPQNTYITIPRTGVYRVEADICADVFGPGIVRLDRADGAVHEIDTFANWNALHGDYSPLCKSEHSDTTLHLRQGDRISLVVHNTATSAGETHPSLGGPGPYLRVTWMTGA